MNYRHAFHAGNHADVFKHLTLTRLIALMSRKEQPFAYIDSHAGIGLYDLKGDQATRTGEYLEGIARLWGADDLPELTADYMRVLRRLNPDGELRYYPGSPELARRLMRNQDRALLNEKHPEDGLLLKDNMKGDRRVAVHLGEGWHVARALLPVAEKRAVMLIDPPFEQLDEMQRCAASMKEAIGRMRQTVAAIWYPVKDPAAVKRFHAMIAGLGLAKCLTIEAIWRPVDGERLAGAGLVTVNAPFTLGAACRAAARPLWEALGIANGRLAVTGDAA